MANDTATSVTRNRAIFDNLLRQLPPAERDRCLAQHADDLQRSVDAVLALLSGVPTSVRARPRFAAAPPPVNAPVPIESPPTSGPIPVAPAEPHNHNGQCQHVQQAVASVEVGTVPAAVRAVLATESTGLLTRQIVEGVNVLRPGTDENQVSGALHVMRKRGELAREGFHKNYRYRLTNLALSLHAAQGGDAE